jgi:hypothetical protein
MSQHPEEDQFRSFFGELKRRDDRIAPSFEPERSKADLTERSILSELRYGRLTAIALGVGTVIAIACIARHPQHGSAPIAINAPLSHANDGHGVEMAAQSLSDWKSPTAFLLPSTDDWNPSSDESPVFLPTTQPQPRHSS